MADIEAYKGEEEMNFISKRRRYLIVALVIQIFAGFLYAWSVVQSPLSEKFGWSSAAISLAYTFNILGTTVVTLFGSGLKKKLALRRCILVGGVVIGIGLMMCGMVRSSVIELYIYYGLFYGIGVGLVYPTLTVYCVQLYPEWSGTDGGLSTGAFSMGAFIRAPIATAIRDITGDISYSFLYMGAVMLVAIVVLSFFLREVPEGFAVSGKAVAETTATPVARDISRGEMLRSGVFYALMVTLSLGLAAGSMIVSYSSSIVQTTFGMPLQTASIVVGAMSISSAAGRLGWGAISDVVGKRMTLLMMNAVMCVAMGLLLVVDQAMVFIGLMVICVLCYGGFACMVSPITKELFGERYFADNYAVMYLSYAISSLVGPPIISLARDMTGQMSGAYLMGILFSALGVILSVYLIWKSRAVNGGH